MSDRQKCRGVVYQKDFELNAYNPCKAKSKGEKTTARCLHLKISAVIEDAMELNHQEYFGRK